MPLLEIHNATVIFRNRGHETRAVDDVSLAVDPGRIVAIVGESGSGKTTLARAVLGLQQLDSGEIRMNGETLASRSGLASRIGMVWQDPYASLDPRWRVGRLISEPAALNGEPCDIPELMKLVGLDPALIDRYPHQLSGGQRQRVAIGRALALRPPLVICDEPTAALDLSVQAQILNLLKSLQAEIHCSILYISHDLLTVRFLADHVIVMQNGRIVEQGSPAQVFEAPEREYTRALLAAAPNLEAILAG